MDYVELNISTADAQQSEILVAELGELPFESFTEEGRTLKAYIPKERLVDCKAEVDALLESYGVYGARYISIEPQNWNALWESNFDPVTVTGECVIRAPFHAPHPELPYDIVIMPKMSFGTGHHDTTCLVATRILERDLSGKRGLDMGSGTGVLAIIAVRRGAERVDAVDIDEWAYENCRENIAENGVADRVVPILGDVSAIAGRRYDFILANINRNILLADMARYVASLDEGGELIMSGILERDIPALSDCAASLGLHDIVSFTRNGWASVVCRK